MHQRKLLRRALARVAELALIPGPRLVATPRSSAPAAEAIPPPPSSPPGPAPATVGLPAEGAGTASTWPSPPGDAAADAVAAVATEARRDGAAPVPPLALSAPTCPGLPEQVASDHRRGLDLARAGRWNHAQRALEAARRAAPEGPAAADLASVRAVRRQLRALAKWPRDVEAHLLLGQAYMELELGEHAEEVFRRVTALARGEPRAYIYLALEYAYRGENDEAERAYTQARGLDESLPTFSSALARWSARPEPDTTPPTSAASPERDLWPGDDRVC